jgi:hypothetical protein
MAGKPSPALIAALTLVVKTANKANPVAPFAAVGQDKHAAANLYRSRLYKLWLASGKGQDKAKLAELKKALGMTASKAKKPHQERRTQREQT